MLWTSFQKCSSISDWGDCWWRTIKRESPIRRATSNCSCIYYRVNIWTDLNTSITSLKGAVIYQICITSIGVEFKWIATTVIYCSSRINSNSASTSSRVIIKTHWNVTTRTKGDISGRHSLYIKRTVRVFHSKINWIFIRVSESSEGVTRGIIKGCVVNSKVNFTGISGRRWRVWRKWRWWVNGNLRRARSSNLSASNVYGFYGCPVTISFNGYIAAFSVNILIKVEYNIGINISIHVVVKSMVCRNNARAKAWCSDITSSNN